MTEPLHPFAESISTERVVAEWQRYAVAETVSESLARTAEFTAHADRIFGGMVLRLEHDILTDRRAEDEYQASLHFPASTWQMWKRQHGDSWWLGWFVRWRPVVTHEYVVTVKVERWQTYPEARLPRERFGRAVVYENVTGPLWKERPW